MKKKPAKTIMSFLLHKQINHRTYLHSQHQHLQYEGNYGTGLAYWSTLVAGWKLSHTGHRLGLLVHCQRQSGHCYMQCHLQAWTCAEDENRHACTNSIQYTCFQCMHIPVACRPQLHRCCPSCHHTLSPTGH